MRKMLKLRRSASVTTACSKATSASAGFALPASGCRRIWLWNVIIHLPGGLPMGSAKDLDTAKADFKAAWEVLKAKTSPEELLAAYRDLNLGTTAERTGTAASQNIGGPASSFSRSQASGSMRLMTQ